MHFFTRFRKFGQWLTVIVIVTSCLTMGCSRQQEIAIGQPFVADSAGEEEVLTAIDMKFCWCPPGKFNMGSPADEPGRDENETQVAVTLTHGFWLGKYEVTQDEYQQVMGRNPSQFKGDRFPVDRASWHEATKFCERLTVTERSAGRLPESWEYSLPTEAQWEYACRAGTTTAWSFGDDAKQLNGFGWYMDNSDRKTHEVGQKKPNAWGFCDMHGNVRWAKLTQFPRGLRPVSLSA